MNKTFLLSFASLLGIASTLPSKVLPEDQQSRHFQAINQHLDFGGVLYGYVDVDGDVDKLIDLAGGFIETMRITNPRDFPFEIDLKRILQATGLDKIKGIGASSYKDGDRFRNKILILAPGERHGLLKIVGDQPHAFKSWSLAPTGADLVVEQDLNGQAVYEVVLDIAGIVMGHEGRGMIEAQVRQPVPDLGFTLEKVIKDLDLTISVVVDVHENRLLRVPDVPEPGVKVPLTDAIVVIDKLGWLVDHLVPLAQEEEELRVFRNLQWEGIELNEAAPGDFKIYKPSMMKHLRSGSLVLTTRREFAERCFSEKQSLAEDLKFQAAMEGLPRKGNAFAYMAPTIHKTIEGIIKQIPKEEMGGVEVSVAMSLVSFFIPGKDGPETSVTVNLPEGFLTTGNSGSSLKAGFATTIFAGPMLTQYAVVMPMMLYAQYQQQEVFIDEAAFVDDIEAIEVPVQEFIPEGEAKNNELKKKAREIERIRRRLEQQERKVPTVPEGD
ncbi:MAG: hypothetical protein CMI32_07150 [Opitutales bacterium]|nr:hypothetical protein [Opitutales bacterium]